MSNAADFVYFFIFYTFFVRVKPKISKISIYKCAFSLFWHYHHD